MGYLGAYLGATVVDGGGGSPPPVAEGVSTVENIRDQIMTLVEGVTPASGEGTKFIRLRAEQDGDPREWAQNNPAGALRRFLSRDVGDDEPPAVSNTTVEERIVTIETVIAYPQNARFGRTNSLGRDDVIVQDWKAIDFLIGICGAGNFSGSNNCTPLGCTKSVERVGKVDFLVIRGRYRFWRATT